MQRTIKICDTHVGRIAEIVASSNPGVVDWPRHPSFPIPQLPYYSRPHEKSTDSGLAGNVRRRDRAGGKLRASDGARRDQAAIDLPGDGAGRDGIRCGRDRLTRRDVGVGARARAWTHGDLQPPRAAFERARAVVEPHGEEAVGDGEVVHHVASSHGGAAARRVEEREEEIVRAVGRRALIGEPALIGEGGALGEKVGCASDQRQRGDQGSKNLALRGMVSWGGMLNE